MSELWCRREAMLSPERVTDANPLPVEVFGNLTPAPATTGGVSTYPTIDLDETEEEIKATAGLVYGWYLYNNTASVRYVKIYNASAAHTTVGTTIPRLVIPLPANAGANVGLPFGIEFPAGITIAATTGVAHTDTGGPGANDVIANIFYK